MNEETEKDYAQPRSSVKDSLATDHEDEDEIIGYVDPWIVQPGATVSVKISSTVPRYHWSLVRLIQGLDHEKAPPVQKEVIIPESNTSIQTGSFKRAVPGSYALVNAWKDYGTSAGPTVTRIRCTFFVQPWLVNSEHPQTLMSTLDAAAFTGMAAMLDSNGSLCVATGHGDDIKMYESGIALRRWRWARVQISIDQSKLRIDVQHLSRLSEPAPVTSNFEVALSSSPRLTGRTPLTLAAAFCTDGMEPSSTVSNRFNGRLDSFKIETSQGPGTNFEVWADYNFAIDISSDIITDTSPAQRNGVLVNAPTRAVKGHDWDGSEPDWTKAKYGYGAIHFHEDDLDDADWATDFTVTIPNNAVSGAYAVIARSVTSDVKDTITFFVTPSQETQPNRKARTALVLSTFTYLAYANEHMYEEDRASHMELAGGVSILKSNHWRRMARRNDLGLGLYDTHRDGSGTVFSSAKRPILNVRPDYWNWAFHRPREFSADLLMVGFLEARLGKGGYDVLTDHDLHIHGVQAVADYDVIITGSHPEYPSLKTLDVYVVFAREGGHIMYLGGNGFYWCSETDPERPHRLEVRRGDQGCRSFSLPGGERMHSLTGAQGGLWRSRGRLPQTLFGIGSCACGSGPGVPYKVTEEAAKSGNFGWLWEGLTPDDSGNLPLIGENGFGGGSSGDEIDRLDFDLGTPSNAVLLATSTGHDDSFGLFNEEAVFPMVNTLGTSCDKVRSDMVYYETSAGGAVFSVGSINWYCSLGWQGYKNNVAAITWNVLREFLRRGLVARKKSRERL